MNSSHGSTSPRRRNKVLKMGLIDVTVLSFFVACGCFVSSEEMNKTIFAKFCPKNIEKISEGYGSAVVTWEEPKFIGNLEGTKIRVNPSKRAGRRFPVGTTPVTYKAIDDFGNTAWCNFTVTVIEGVCSLPAASNKESLTCLKVNGKMKVCAKACQAEEKSFINFRGLRFCSNRGNWVHVKLFKEAILGSDPETKVKGSCGEKMDLKMMQEMIKAQFIKYLKMETPFCLYEPEKSLCLPENVNIIMYY